MKLRWLIAVALVGATGVAVAGPVHADRSIARVGEAVIWESDLARASLDELIDEALILAEAKQAQITASDDDALAAIAEIKAKNQLDDAGLDALLRERGYTRARYLRDVRRQLTVLRAKNLLVATTVVVTDAEVAAEAKARKLPAGELAALKQELRQRELDAATAAWVAQLRARTWIEKRP